MTHDLHQAVALYHESYELLKRASHYSGPAAAAMLRASAILWDKAVELTPPGIRSKKDSNGEPYLEIDQSEPKDTHRVGESATPLTDWLRRARQEWVGHSNPSELPVGTGNGVAHRRDQREPDDSDISQTK